MNDSLCIFTANADDILIASGARVGITVNSYSCQWKGYVTGKLREGVKFLQGRTEQFAMWIDGMDTLILKPEVDILARLQAYGFTVVIAAEATCWPDEHLAGKYNQMLPQPRYLNAGGFIGLRGEVMTAMHAAIQCAEGDEDDQRAWTKAYLAGMLPNVQIDGARQIFCSEGDGNTEKADPCTRHFNGRAPGREEYWGKVNA